MCGIGAIIHGDIRSLASLMEPVRDRGEPSHFNENASLDDVALGCNRLAIVDPRKSIQPVQNEDGTVIGVLSGEIYNFMTLRSQLRSLGHRFRTKGDTEIIVHGYEEWGEQLPAKLDGEFAFILYDSGHDSFLAARDPFGVRPLFYTQDRQSVAIGSEAKQFLSLSSSSYVRELQPGYLLVNNGARKYFEPKIPSIGSTTKEIADDVFGLCVSAVEKRVQTDLPIAVFLSGGLDSTGILSCAKWHCGSDVTAIIMGFEKSNIDSDAYAAKKFCDEFNVPYIWEEPPEEADLFSSVPEVVRITESFEPNMIKQAALSNCLSQCANRHGFKVALCGEGADELFYGYPEFAAMPHLSSRELDNVAMDFFQDLYRTQLARVDRTAMAHTLEVRVPYLDPSLVAYAQQIPAHYKIREGISKWILRQAFSMSLPAYIKDRKKVVLSEGMGLKGNSPENGLFTALASAAVQEEELRAYQAEYPQFRLRTREEACYFRHYIACGYQKIEFKGRPHVNKISSINDEKT